MPRVKRLDVGEKANVMAWFVEDVATREIADCSDPSTVRRIIIQSRTWHFSQSGAAQAEFWMPKVKKTETGRGCTFTSCIIRSGR
jgi:hypothetical protein